jgi:hypothetical protein
MTSCRTLPKATLWGDPASRMIKLTLATFFVVFVFTVLCEIAGQARNDIDDLIIYAIFAYILTAK